MRIIIEIDKDGLPVQVQTEAEGDESSMSDGGASPAVLPGDQASSDLDQAETAGGPPDWLAQSIESAMAAEAASQDDAADEDGGAASV